MGAGQEGLKIELTLKTAGKVAVAAAGDADVVFAKHSGFSRVLVEPTRRSDNATLLPDRLCYSASERLPASGLPHKF